MTLQTVSLPTKLPLLKRRTQVLLSILAFIIPATISFQQMSAPAPLHVKHALPRIETDNLKLEAPLYDPSKPTVVVLMGAGGTEMTDFIQPYVVFAESGKFNVYAVGPSRSSSTMIGDIKVIPHYSFDEFSRLNIHPKLIVIPYIAPRFAFPVTQWIRQTAGDQTQILSVCAGAQVLAATGLLKNHSATTHQSYFERLKKNYPQTHWIEGVRYVDSGNIVTSGGITAGVDGALHVLDKMTDRQTAEEVARRLGYPNLQFLDSPAYHTFELTPQRQLAYYAAGANYLFLKNKQQLGIFLYDGVSEIEIAGIMDTYYVSAAYENVTIAAKPQVVRTQHNLFVIPEYDFESAPHLDRLLVPGGESTPTKQIEGWARVAQAIAVEYPQTSSIAGIAAYPFEAALKDIAWRQGQLVALNVARDIEYPTEHLKLRGFLLPPILLIPLASGLTGLTATLAFNHLVISRKSQHIRAL